MSKGKVVIITIGQPSTNPRAVKEYRSLKMAGYQVKFFYAYWADWAIDADESFFREDGIDRDDFMMAGGRPVQAPLVYHISRLFYKVARVANARGVPLFRKWSLNRPAYFLYRSAKREKADLYIAHNLAALPVAYLAARRHGAACGFDAEDFHRGQFVTQAGKEYETVKWTEECFMVRCDYLTAASPLIAAAYRKALSLEKEPQVINNVFSLGHLQAIPAECALTGIGVFWFSQTIGKDRGLEQLVEAINRLDGLSISLHVLGDHDNPFAGELVGLAKNPGKIHFLGTVPPDEIFAIAAKFDIGLAAELPYSENRDICLTNKLFTYLLAGNCILASDTRAQQAFLHDHPQIGVLYKNGDVDDLARTLKRLRDDKVFLLGCRKAARELAASTFNWETESAVFLSVISSALAS